MYEARPYRAHSSGVFADAAKTTDWVSGLWEAPSASLPKAAIHNKNDINRVGTNKCQAKRPVRPADLITPLINIGINDIRRN